MFGSNIKGNFIFHRHGLWDLFSFSLQLNLFMKRKGKRLMVVQTDANFQEQCWFWSWLMDTIQLCLNHLWKAFPLWLFTYEYLTPNSSLAPISFLMKWKKKSTPYFFSTLCWIVYYYISKHPFSNDNHLSPCQRSREARLQSEWCPTGSGCPIQTSGSWSCVKQISLVIQGKMSIALYNY